MILSRSWWRAHRMLTHTADNRNHMRLLETWCDVHHGAHAAHLILVGDARFAQVCDRHLGAGLRWVVREGRQDVVTVVPA